ncbi:hypothetical protein IAQ61_004359 [Plenodomus lingam]|uniref:uncharacterized protein n=1 Tax=Leptosphaeria maculans TaxID=5022 RepID=UPI00333278D0|nr:hypothetical protein IAQ61_004359 [Plenodomus lingam]
MKLSFAMFLLPVLTVAQECRTVGTCIRQGMGVSKDLIQRLDAVTLASPLSCDAIGTCSPEKCHADETCQNAICVRPLQKIVNSSLHAIFQLICKTGKVIVANDDSSRHQNHTVRMMSTGYSNSSAQELQTSLTKMAWLWLVANHNDPRTTDLCARKPYGTLPWAPDSIR